MLYATVLLDSLYLLSLGINKSHYFRSPFHINWSFQYYSWSTYFLQLSIKIICFAIITSDLSLHQFSWFRRIILKEILLTKCLSATYSYAILSNINVSIPMLLPSINYHLANKKMGSFIWIFQLRVIRFFLRLNMHSVHLFPSPSNPTLNPQPNFSKILPSSMHVGIPNGQFLTHWFLIGVSYSPPPANTERFLLLPNTSFRNIPSFFSRFFQIWTQGLTDTSRRRPRFYRQVSSTSQLHALRSLSSSLTAMAKVYALLVCDLRSCKWDANNFSQWLKMMCACALPTSKWRWNPWKGVNNAGFKKSACGHSSTIDTDRDCKK